MWRAIYHELQRWVKTSKPAVSRVEITLETERVWIIRKAHSKRGWCAECGREVDMVGLSEAYALRGMNGPLRTQSSTKQPSSTQPMLPGCGDSRGWHWSQAENGEPLVCLESVLKSVK
jgi:hypothetical protein